jgi:hypothetical protein
LDVFGQNPDSLFSGRELQVETFARQLYGRMREKSAGLQDVAFPFILNAFTSDAMKREITLVLTLINLDATLLR